MRNLAVFILWFAGVTSATAAAGTGSASEFCGSFVPRMQCIQAPCPGDALGIGERFWMLEAVNEQVSSQLVRLEADDQVCVYGTLKGNTIFVTNVRRR